MSISVSADVAKSSNPFWSARHSSPVREVKRQVELNVVELRPRLAKT
jgi:hypothetical protein